MGQNVIVTNKNAEAWSRRFNGEMFEFKPGEPVTLPEVAATYLFAYGQDDVEKRRILVRNGWQRNGQPGDENGPEAAMKRLQNFIFKAGQADEPPAKPEKKRLPGTPEATKMREPTGIGAMSGIGDRHEQTERKIRDGIESGAIGGRPTIGLPNKKAPLAPPAA